MARVIGFLAISLCLANLAYGAQSEFDEENSRSRTFPSSTPIMFSFKGGVVGALNFDWYQPTVHPAEGRFSHVGFSLEAHDLKGFVVGFGADMSWNTWTREDADFYYGRAMQRLTTTYLYGTLGYSAWRHPAGTRRTWCSIDLGKMWCHEAPYYGSTGVFEGDFSGTAVRVRGSYLHHLTRAVALGVTGGWQWAEPTLQQRNWYHSAPRPRLKLSGPMIAAHISLVSPLGK